MALTPWSDVPSPNRQQRRRDARAAGRGVRRREPRRPPGPVLRPRTAADVACVVPVVLGFHPQESLVALCLHGERRRIGLSVRVDLPPSTGHHPVGSVEPADLLRAQVAEVVHHVARQGAVGVLLVAFTRHESLATLALELASESLEAAGVPVQQAAWTDGERVHGRGCDDASCCPPGGAPYDPAANRWVAAAVADGQEILPARSTLVDRFRAIPSGPDLVAATAAVEREVAALVGDGDRPHHEPVLVRAGRGVTRAAAARPSPLSDDDVATLSVWTGSVVVRDLLWADITRDTAREALALWREVGRRAVPDHRAPALALAGFAAWMCGDGAQAVTALELALEADPAHSMSELVLGVVIGGVDPAWWEHFPPEEVLRAVPGLDEADRADLLGRRG